MTMFICLRSATPDDVALLARMNRQLIEDEGSRNPMSLDQLEARMRCWLGGGWSITIVLAGDEVAGYAVYQVRRDEYCPDQQLVYVRQFFIRRELRRQGIGKSGA
ncbi:MAG: GNAT family N-acetyltransferase [Chloroflexi bacterium]|nr:GNAT family N-acetyltransferase [Chloroflexota bacterium]